MHSMFFSRDFLYPESMKTTGAVAPDRPLRPLRGNLTAPKRPPGLAQDNRVSGRYSLPPIILLALASTRAVFSPSEATPRREEGREGFLGFRAWKPVGRAGLFRLGARCALCAEGVGIGKGV